MPLTEDKRKQLDNIVTQMINNKESDSNIQFIVDDFKNKYGSYQKPSFGQKVDIGAMAFGQNLAHSATLGLRDHLNALVNSVVQEGRELITKKDKKPFTERYKSNLQREQEFREDLKKKAPIMSMAGDIAGYVTPGGVPSAIGKGVLKGVTTAAPKLMTKSMVPIGKGIITGTEAGIIEGTRTGLETGDVKKGLETGKMAAIFGGAMGAAGPGISKGLKKFGEKNIAALLRPGQTGRKEGFKIGNVFKHKVDDVDLEKMNVKVSTKLDNLMTNLNQIVKENEKITLDVGRVYDDVLDHFYENRIKNVGLNQHIDFALRELGEELSEVITSPGKLKIKSAIDLKRATGTHRKSKFIAGEKPAEATNKVYQEFYIRLNEVLKKKLPEKYQKINQDFTELIPIKSAIKRREPIQTSNYGISPLMGIMAGMGAVGGYGAGGDFGSTLKGAAVGATGKYMFTSPRVARGAYKLSKTKIPQGLKVYGAGKLADIVK